MERTATSSAFDKFRPITKEDMRGKRKQGSKGWQTWTKMDTSGGSTRGVQYTKQSFMVPMVRKEQMESEKFNK
jgi:hypothetical protein